MTYLCKYKTPSSFASTTNIRIRNHQLNEFNFSGMLMRRYREIQPIGTTTVSETMLKTAKAELNREFLIFYFVVPFKISYLYYYINKYKHIFQNENKTLNYIKFYYI